MFEAKSYNDLRKTFAAANILLAVAWLGLVYAFVLTPRHKQVLYVAFNTIKVDPVWGSLLTMALIASAWGFVTTYLVRLHDRLYEPHLVTWRANYETDYILRSLCAAYPQRVSERFFEHAFSDVTLRGRFMQRLFYKFMGDSKSEHEELLEHFYTTIQNYWLLALAEVYGLAFLLAVPIYCWLSGQPAPPYKTWTGIIVVTIFLRVWSNRYLRKIRPITAEQIYVVLHEHFEAFNQALGAILTEHDL